MSPPLKANGEGKRSHVTHEMKKEIHMLNLKGFIDPQIDKEVWQWGESHSDGEFTSAWIAPFD